MRVYVIGTRGFPGIQGGVEKHCESLYPLIGRQEWHITVFRRKPYINSSNRSIILKNICFRDVWTSRLKGVEAIMHSFIVALICLRERPDVVHLHNIGPSLVLPLLKLGRLKTVVTYHSPNYEHSKWNSFAKIILKTGEKFVSILADQVIFVSRTQFDKISCRSKTLIVNGVFIPNRSSFTDFLQRLDLQKQNYFLVVGRLVPEKGIHDLIEAFGLLDTSYKLVIAGDADHASEYSRELKERAAKHPGIVMTGYVTGEPLNQLYSHAGLFVLPSYHEGLPIVLLEAMSYGLPVLVSDIPANREVGLPSERYFRCGDVSDLARKLEILMHQPLSQVEKESIRRQVADKYDWNKIVLQTIAVYQKVLE